MLTSVARQYNWPPEILGGLFVDNLDLYGLEYWYDDAVDLNRKVKEGPKKTP